MEGWLKTIVEIIAGILLIRNQVEGDVGKNIRGVGILIVTYRVVTWLIAAIVMIIYGPKSDLMRYVFNFSILLHVIVFAAMARMYQQERKSLANQ